MARTSSLHPLLGCIDLPGFGTIGCVIDAAIRLFEAIEEQILELSQNPWFLLILFVVALLDSVVPIVPSEFSVIAGGVAAGSGELLGDFRVVSIILVILAGAIGAYAGDSLGYWIGMRSDTALKNLFFRGEKGGKRLIATGEQIRKRGGMLLITARFIPGGRTAMTFSCGLTRQPFWSWFTRWDLLATFLWASYAGLLGFFASNTIEDPGTALLVAFGFALGVTLLIEVGRFVRDRIRGPESSDLAEPA